ncbi:hypothetical protein BWQ96_08311 [Gracilariopsis chorda]|uniref:Ubiquitin-like protease family profile domain-containing protein n=1 Tax=Gracilariopsis chorda TaxID=448386 RepID=A0A2V3IIP9_9FLOR|nr:hypothetical protein BWQ96_08311 [Gracilariopsis chorda]|eukprot:PXF41957.1 hypothetical protein BWQ96_08311 [Gracilariopsis chorda]
MTLREGDIKPIVEFHLAIDFSVMFKLSFLTKWTTALVSKVRILDFIRTCGWWDCDISSDTGLLREPTQTVRREKDLYKRVGEAVSRSDVCFMPVCGDAHWSLIELVNLESGLRERLLTAPQKTDGGARILFIDSIGNTSPPKELSENVLYYLRGCYPARFRPSPKAIQDRVACHSFTCQRQTRLECGFCV